MLVLTRRRGERIRVGNHWIKVEEIGSEGALLRLDGILQWFNLWEPLWCWAGIDVVISRVSADKSLALAIKAPRDVPIVREEVIKRDLDFAMRQNASRTNGGQP